MPTPDNRLSCKDPGLQALAERLRLVEVSEYTLHSFQVSASHLCQCNLAACSDKQGKIQVVLQPIYTP